MTSVAWRRSEALLGEGSSGAGTEKAACTRVTLGKV